MTSRRSRGALVLTALLAISCSVISGCGSESASGSGAASGGAGATAQPLATYAATLSTARYSDYAGRPGVGVRDEAAFEDMRQYLIQRYADAQAATSVVSNGIVFDCIRQAGDTASPPPPAPPPSASAQGSQGPTASATQSVIPCPAGSVPVRRITLDDLIRFPTLAAFLSKGPGAVGAPPTGTPPS
jgi:hypothetical protein